MKQQVTRRAYVGAGIEVCIKATSILVAVLLLSGCLSPPAVIEEEWAIFEEKVENNPSVERHTLAVGDHRLFYAAAGDAQKPTLMIMHGTPGNWHQYARYMLNEQLQDQFYIVVIDRPGWGSSTLANDENNKNIATFEEQATIVAALADKLKTENNRQPVILMGHSLGASIAPRVAIDYPQSIDGLLLLAGTLDPALSNPRWFNYVAGVPGAYWLLSSKMTKANKEIFALKSNIQRLDQDWDKLQAYTTVVQGMRDKLVYPANIDFAEKRLNPARAEMIRLPNEGHLFPMTLRNDVVAWSTCLLTKIQTQTNTCNK
jgi:pimeloyl-ACP methyl ester carboxylesterase